jgi:hypothetical protein
MEMSYLAICFAGHVRSAMRGLDGSIGTKLAAHGHLKRFFKAKFLVDVHKTLAFYFQQKSAIWKRMAASWSK